jgi:hypothetical protein
MEICNTILDVYQKNKVEFFESEKLTQKGIQSFGNKNLKTLYLSSIELRDDAVELISPI